MTILEAIEEVVEDMSQNVTLIYADLNEANFDVDKLVGSEFPVLIVLPFIPVDTPGTSGVLKTTFDFQAFLLNKDVMQSTVDYRAIEVENNVVAPMRMLAREFMHKFNEHTIIDPEDKIGIGARTYQPIYSSMDANLHGVFIRARVPVMEGITGCVD